MTRFLFLWLMVMSYSTQSTGLDVDINVFSFFSNKTYAEIHLRVNANSVEYFLEEGKEKASVECILIAVSYTHLFSFCHRFFNEVIHP